MLEMLGVGVLVGAGVVVVLAVAALKLAFALVVLPLRLGLGLLKLAVLLPLLAAGVVVAPPSWALARCCSFRCCSSGRRCGSRLTSSPCSSDDTPRPRVAAPGWGRGTRGKMAA